MTGRLWAPQGLGLADPLLVCTWVAMACFEPQRAPSRLSSALGSQGKERLHSLLPAVGSRYQQDPQHCAVPTDHHGHGQDRWTVEEGRSSSLVRLQYHFGTDKSDHASQGLATIQANSPQWDIFQSPQSRVSHLTWRRCSPTSTAVSGIGPWSLALEGMQGNSREGNAPLLHVCSALHKADKSSVWPIWAKKQRPQH